MLAASTTAASSTPFRETYAYSPLGNLTGWKQNTSATTTYSYAETGSTNPHAPTNVGGVGLKYDTNGNLTNYGVKSFTWDWRNRMATSSSGVASTTYAYDHTSERVKKTVGSVTTLYANDYWNKGGATTTRQIYANGEVIATIEGNGTATTTRYMHADQLGSVQASTDNAGNVSEVTDYYPYGSERLSTGTYDGQRKFIGEITDADGMSYLNARYYQSSRGQFISQDPVFWEVGMTPDGKAVLANPQAQNSYSYAENNPITKKDPQGRFAFVPIAIGAGVGLIGGVGAQAFSDYLSGDFGNRSVMQNIGRYSVAAVSGATVGAGTVVAGVGAAAAGLSAGATTLAVSGTAGVLTAGTTLAGNQLLGQQTDPTGLAVSAGVSAVTAGTLKGLPGVPGR